MYTSVASNDYVNPFTSDLGDSASPRKERNVFHHTVSPVNSWSSAGGIELLSPCPDTTLIVSDPTNHSRKKRFWHDTKQELRTVPWRKFTRRFTSLVLPVFLIYGLLLTIISISIPGMIFASGDVCRPDGSFYQGLAVYSPWRTSSLFQIDVGFGRLSFTDAKLIDFWWDLLAGRRGQLLMAFVAYKACTKSIIRRMEVQAIPTRTFEAISIQDSSVPGLFKLLTTISANRDSRSVTSMIWLIVATAFVIWFPSFVSAGSGYSANLDAYILVDSVLVPWDRFNRVRYIIHDGKRLGGEFYDNYPVTWAPASANEEVLNDWGDCYHDFGTQYVNGSYQTSPTSRSTPHCNLLWNIGMYGTESGFLGQNESSSIFNNSDALIDLKAPTLNITAYFAKHSTASTFKDPSEIQYYQSQRQYHSGFFWKNPKTGQFTFGDVYNPLLIYNNKTYNNTQVGNLGRCQQTTVQYKWGFSFMLLFSLLLSLIIWSIGMYAMYMDSYLNSRLDMIGRDLGLQRATLDLASAIEPSIPKEQDDLAGNERVSAWVAGSTISYSHLVSDPLSSTRGDRLRMKWKEFRFKQWAKKDKWWFSFTVLIGLLLWFLSWYPNGLILPLAATSIFLSGLVLVLIAGPESKSRWLIFVVATAIFALLTALYATQRGGWMDYLNPVYIGLLIANRPPY